MFVCLNKDRGLGRDGGVGGFALRVARLINVGEIRGSTIVLFGVLSKEEEVFIII